MSSNNHSQKSSSKPMTANAASRIQSAEARQGDGTVQTGGFASRAQSTAATNAQRGQGK